MTSPYPTARAGDARLAGRYRASAMAGPSDTRAPDAEALARRATALEQVRVWGDPVLRTPARPVERFDGALVEQAARMARLMDEALGAGLAANQVGLLNRLLVYRLAPDAPLRVLVNPEVEWAADDEELFAEGCLSLPGVWVEVPRPARVRVRARDEHGRPVVVDAEGREASVVQHEIDHLDGVLVLDRLPADERRAAVRRLREAAAEGRR
jgi:peptide deformylase